jgi:hypothetical protein
MTYFMNYIKHCIIYRSNYKIFLQIRHLILFILEILLYEFYLILINYNYFIVIFQKKLFDNSKKQKQKY